MITGLIYKYTNLLNEKSYIGQTSTSLELRDKKHLSELNDNTYFHRALKKYGRNNFSLTIIEDNIPLEQLDEREKYWINYYDTYYIHNKGYNMTQGGKWGNSNQKVIGKDIEEIKKLLLTTDTTFITIAQQFNVSLSCISDINTGRVAYDNSLTYPLRNKYQRSELTQETASEIIQLLLENNLTQKEIAQIYNIKEFTVGNINRGKSSWCPSNLDYPLSKGIKQYTYCNKITPEIIIQLLYDIFYTSLTLKQIGEKYNIAKNTVGDISRGLTWKEVTEPFIFPLRKNKLKNQKIYQSHFMV